MLDISVMWDVALDILFENKSTLMWSLLMLYIPGLLANDKIAFPVLGGYVTSSVQ